jgi:UDP-glucose 4-epimerase
VHTDPRPGDVRRHCGDIRLAAELIGFEPAVTTDENLKETVDWYWRTS